MMIHIRLGGWGLIHMEAAAGYGAKPWLRLSEFGDETIIDIPFCRMILTPQPRCRVRTRTTQTPYFNRAERDSDDKRKLRQSSQAAARLTRDRP